jgi:apolipoprotein N-acyltransferase
MKSIVLLWSALIASAVALTVIQVPISWAPLAWVSLVPFILACSPAAKAKTLAVAAYSVSLCYWLGNLYWVAPVTMLGWAAFCVYTAVLWPIVALCLRYCMTKKIPLFLVAGVLFVGAERLQGFFLGGFFWRFLAHSQYRNTTLIQIADIFGTPGLSFLIAMVNGLLAQLIVATRNKRLFKVPQLAAAAVVCAAVIATVLYGRWRIIQSDEFIEEGPIVASLQSNVPQSVKRSFQESDRIFDELMQKSKAAAKAGAELIVWPETMVQATLEPQVLGLLDPSHPSKVFDQALKDHAKNTSFVLVGAYGGIPAIREDMTIDLVERYNSAFLYRPDGQQDPKRYDKIHLVLFGEVLPFRKSCPLLFKVLMKFNPYDFDHSLDYGSQYTVFEMARAWPPKNPPYRFATIICYEATVPAIARRLTLDQEQSKQIDWLANISNDGWFVRFKDESDKRVYPSTELAQHAAICTFRAVENRLAVLRSVNTGISCLIDSLGRIRDGHMAASQDFPAVAMERKGIAGWFVDKVPIDKRVTFFSKYGQWLDLCCAMCVGLLMIVPPAAGFVRNNKYLTSGGRRRAKRKTTMAGRKLGRAGK